MSEITLGPITSALVRCMVTAWAFDSDKRIYLGAPLLPPKDLPYGVIDISEVPMRGATMSTVEQTLAFKLFGRFPWPGNPDTNILLAKTAIANLLIRQILTGPTFEGLYLPMVTKVSFDDGEEDGRRFLDVLLDFEGRVEVPHH